MDLEQKLGNDHEIGHWDNLWSWLLFCHSSRETFISFPLLLITAAWIILLVVWHSSESIKRPMSLVKNCQWIVPLFLIFGSMDANIEIARVLHVINLPEWACCCTLLVLFGRFWVAGFDMFTIRLLFFSTVSNSSNFCKSKKVFTHSLWIKTIVYEYAPTSWQFLHPLHLSKDVEGIPGFGGRFFDDP